MVGASSVSHQTAPSIASSACRCPAPPTWLSAGRAVISCSSPARATPCRWTRSALPRCPAGSSCSMPAWPARRRMSGAWLDSAALPGRREFGETGRRLALVIERDDLVGARIGEQRAQQLVVQRVAALEGDVAREQRLAGDVHVADRIEDLVLDELVGVAQAFGVEHALVVDD